MPHWYVSEILFVLPSGTKLVMNTVGFKLLSNEAKRLVKAVLGISKKMLRTWLKVQYNAVVFPVYFLYGGLKYVYQKSHTSANESQYPLEPKSDVIVSAVKRLRNSVVSGINGISSSTCDTQTDTLSLSNDSISDEERNTCLYENELSDQILDVAVEAGSSTTENSYESSKISFLGVSDFTGKDLMWDIPVISAKANYFSQCLKEGKRDKITAARKALEEHSINNPIPKTRQEYEIMVDKARNGSEYFIAAVTKCKDSAESRNIYEYNAGKNELFVSNVLEKKHNQKKVEFCFDDNASERYFPSYKINRCNCDPGLTQQGKIMRREIATINKKLRKIHATCSSLLGGLSVLNEDFVKVISMKEKLRSLEFQVDEGRRLLQEVESDRFIMKSKLSALEKLINEEEEFLCDASCESGFYESENNTSIVGEL